MSLHRILRHAMLTDPLMIVAFDAWVDAGSASTAAAETLADGAGAIAELETDGLFDYRSRRPTLHIDSGRLTSVDWPGLQVVHRAFPDRDALILTGQEPDYRWRELADDMADLAQELGVSQWLTLGSIPAAVPHTRSVPVLGTQSQDGLLRGGVEAGPIGSMQVPSAAVSVIELAVAASGVPTLGYFAQVPHYVSGPYPAAAVALIRAVEPHIGATIPTTLLEMQARSVAAKLDTAAAADDSTHSYVERLEALSDETRLPSGDELIGEIERFLREREGDEGGGSRPN